MRPQYRPKPAFRLAVLVIAALSLSPQAPAASPPALTDPSWSGGQFQFTLQGQTNVGYILESSSNLRIWSPVLTNTDAQATRVISLPAPSGHGFWRARRVPGPLFVHAIAARGGVLLGGSGWVDSFDSADPNFSTNGQFDPAKRKAGGNIASGTNVIGAVDVGNMQVAGVVSTAPGGTVWVGPNGGVGSIPWLNNPVNDGLIEHGHLRDDFDESFPDSRFPASFSSLALSPGAGVVGGTPYQYVLGNGDYRILGLSVGLGQSMIVTGRARLHILGITSVSGSIIVATNASVEWYAVGNVSISGSGIINVAAMANNVSIIGLSTCTTIVYSGSSRFVGTIYAPTANVTLTGTADAIGAVVGKSMALNGAMGLHFDENLKRVGPFF